MRPRRLPHVFVLVWTSVALAQGHAVPDFATQPPKFAVTPFENHVPGGKSLEWIVAEAPFEIAEKTEAVLGLDATGGPLYVPGERVPPDADTVFEYGKKQGVQFVVTGWFDRLGEQLRMVMLVWKTDKSTAKVVGEAQRLGPITGYHKLLGEVMGEAWSEAGIAVGPDRAVGLARPLSNDIYPVFMMGRGLGHFSGALAAMSSVFGTGSAGPGPDVKAAEHDLERAVFLDPKLFEAQRLVGEFYLATAKGDPKLVAKAAGKFNYAADLAPEDPSSVRAAAFAMERAGKWEVALDRFAKLVRMRPWDLDARFRLGNALWQTGDAKAAEQQLEIVTARMPDHLPARRVLVLIHSARSDTPKLIRELEAIAARAPTDLNVKSDLATAYSAVGNWDKAINELELVARDHSTDMPLLVRLGDAYRKANKLDRALPVYQRAQRLDPDSGLPGFAAAQALYDAGRYVEAMRMYLLLQKGADQPAAEHALGAIAFMQNRADDAAWYFRKASRTWPRNVVMRRALVAGELLRKDTQSALIQVEPALTGFPNDGVLHYLAAVAHQAAGDTERAKRELEVALKHSPGFAPAKNAQQALAAGRTFALEYKPELVRPWGDGEALQAAIDQYALLSTTMATVRVEYQAHALAIIGLLGKGPSAKVKVGTVRTCPLDASMSWDAAQKLLARYARLGGELEQTYRFIARHDEIGMTEGLLPNARKEVAAAKKSFKVALADMGELRSEWIRGVIPELRAVGCSDKLLAAAVKDPLRYRVIKEDKPEVLPPKPPPRAKPRTTFFVDNSRCAEPVDVWIDGSHVGQVAPGRRSALVADGGERTLCLLVPGGAQCGDRGTVRQVYLHDGWVTTIYCPK